MALRLALIDGMQLFREGLKALFATRGGFDVVAEAGDAAAAFTAIDSARPDVVLSEMVVPGSSGAAITRELCRRNPQQRVLILSTNLTEESVAQALDAGALGYAGKDQSDREVFDAIQQVAAGSPYLSPRISRFVLDDYLRQRRGDPRRAGPLGTLSAREKEVFELLVLGLGNAEIADKLAISRRTVETHRGHILRKLGLHSLSDVFRFAAKHGLLRE